MWGEGEGERVETRPGISRLHCCDTNLIRSVFKEDGFSSVTSLHNVYIILLNLKEERTFHTHFLLPVCEADRF